MSEGKVAILNVAAMGSIRSLLISGSQVRVLVHPPYFNILCRSGTPHNKSCPYCVRNTRKNHRCLIDTRQLHWYR